VEVGVVFCFTSVPLLLLLAMHWGCSQVRFMDLCFFRSRQFPSFLTSITRMLVETYLEIRVEMFVEVIVKVIVYVCRNVRRNFTNKIHFLSKWEVHQK
jgi:hypothetical protein